MAGAQEEKRGVSVRKTTYGNRIPDTGISPMADELELRRFYDFVYGLLSELEHTDSEARFITYSLVRLMAPGQGCPTDVPIHHHCGSYHLSEALRAAWHSEQRGCGRSPRSF